MALPGRGPELGVWRPWNPGIGGLGPVWPGLGRFPGLADFGVPETTKFPLLPGYRKTRFWGPPTGNSRNSVEFSKKQQKTAYFPLLQANSGGYPPKQGNSWVREGNSGVPGRGRRILGSGTPESGIASICAFPGNRPISRFSRFWQNSTNSPISCFLAFPRNWAIPGNTRFPAIPGFWPIARIRGLGRFQTNVGIPGLELWDDFWRVQELAVGAIYLLSQFGAWLLGKCSPLSDRCGCFIYHRDFGDQT